MKNPTKLWGLGAILLVMITVAGCGKTEDTDLDTATVVVDEEVAYAPPTVEEFYGEIETIWLATSADAQDMTAEQRATHLKKVLTSHESHLPSLKTLERKNITYEIVVKLVMDAMNDDDNTN